MSLEDLPEDIIYKIIMIDNTRDDLIRNINLHRICKKLYCMIINNISERMNIIRNYCMSNLFCECTHNSCCCKKIHPHEMGRKYYARIFDFSYSNIANNHLQYLQYPEKINLAGTKIDDNGLKYLKTVKYLNIEGCQNIIGHSLRELTDLKIIIIFNNPKLELKHYNSLFLRKVKVYMYDQER